MGRGWDGVRATDGGEGENNILNEYTEADTDNESTPPATSNLYPIEEHYKSRPPPFLSPSPSTPPAIQITDVAAQQYYQPPAPADQKFTHHIGREWGTMPKTDLPPGSLAGAEGSSLCYYVWRTGLGYGSMRMDIVRSAMNYRTSSVLASHKDTRQEERRGQKLREQFWGFNLSGFRSFNFQSGE